MTIYSEMSNGILLMRPHQAVDYAAAEEITERINLLSDTGIDALLLDMSEAQHACATLVKVLVDLVNGPHRATIALVGASQQFQSLIRLCGADKLISEYPSVSHAQNALTRMHHNDYADSARSDEAATYGAGATLSSEEEDEYDAEERFIDEDD